MIILGKNSNDKGKQLEQLTKDILIERGYQNIVTNEISIGGEEIDVSGEVRISTFNGEQQIKKMICECKAYNTCITTNHWLKFLGKIFIEENLLNDKIFGTFIVLSDVNGNVAGSYNILKNKIKNIKIVRGDDLLEILSKLFKFCSLKELNNKLNKITQRQIKSTEIIYYDRNIYWLIEFENNVYTVLNAEGAFLEESKVILINELIKTASLPFYNYIDLNKELLCQRRETVLQKFIITKIMQDNGISDFDLILEYCNINKTEEKFDADEVQSGINKLKSKDWILQDNKKISFHEKNKSNFYELMAEIYLFLLKEAFPIHAIECKYYDSCINENMVKEIQKIQGGITFSTEDISNIIYILKLSPTALGRSLLPISMIINHRKSSHIEPRIEASDKNYYFSVLYNSLYWDFSSVPALMEYFYKLRGLREIEILKNIIIKNEASEVLKLKLSERIAIGQMSEELGGGFGSILLIEDAPQPWELTVK